MKALFCGKVIVVILVCSVSLASAAPRAEDVIVCLGDSITDGCTYPQIIVQALKEAGRPVPTVVCSGVVCDTAPQMAARLERTVLAFKPTIVTFAAGTNDAHQGEPAEEYEKALREIVEKVKAAGARMVLLTPCVISPKLGPDGAVLEDSIEPAKKLDEFVARYEKVIRKVAAEEGYPVAENNALMTAARNEGKRVMSPDGIHPNYLGQSLMARSILDAMGCRDVPLPKEFKPRLFPGVIREWKMRPAPTDAKNRPVRLTEETVAQLKPDDTWVTYTLPDPVPADKPSAEDWWEQERRNGFGLKLHEKVGKGLIQAVAVIRCERPRTAWINTAAGIQTVWLNGKKVYTLPPGIIGFHAGRERVPVRLQAGDNTLAVEINGGQFFLSVTDKLVWEADLR